MTNNARITLIIGIVALGLVFEGLKNFSGAPSGAAADAGNAFKPYAIHETNSGHRLRTRQQPELATSQFQAARKMADNSLETLKNALAKYQKDQGSKKTKDKGAEGKKKKNNGYAWVWDKKLHKWVWKKKSDKKDKKENVAKAGNENTDTSDLQDKADDNDSSIDQAVADVLTTGTLPAVAPDKDPKFLSLEEWENLLLGQPDFKQTTKFIEKYRTHLVTAEVFYTIVQMMLEDSRADMNQLGLMAIGMTPSQRSFNTLADYSVKQSFSSTLRQHADQYLTTYTSLSYLPILQSALQSSDADVATVAAKQLEASARKNLTKSSSTNPSNPPHSQQTSPTLANASSYQSFLSILQSLAQSSTDSALQRQAQQTLSSLQHLLNV